jgi:hypothetical protein
MLVKDKRKCTWYDKEITADRYNEILTILRNRPAAPDGYGYRLTESLDWELYELPPVEGEEAEGDATEADYLEALAELGVTDEEK